MTPSHRIIVNTLATYARSVIAAGFALFSSRWVLNAMGQADYGLYALVGSLIVFVTFINGVLGGSATRHFAFAIGKGGDNEVNQWFNTALIIHTVLPVILILIGWPIGEYCIRRILTIPPDRILVCVWVFRLSLISTFAAMFSVPFMAMFIAKQNITETAVWQMLSTLANFIFAYYLTRASGDPLFIYAIGMVSICTLFSLIQILRALFIFSECRISRQYWFNRDHTSELFGFAAWTFIGNLGTLLRGQGTAILLNLFHGPTANAAYGIANQVSSQTLVFSNAMTGAMAPEITTTAGRGDRERLLGLALRASKFGTLLALLFAVPLILEMDYVITLWLKIPPAHTVIFCQLVLIAFLIDRLTVGHMLAIIGNGKVAAYQASVGVIMLLTLPIGYLLLKVFAAPSAALVAFLITSVGCGVGRIYWGQRLLHLPSYDWLTCVLGRSFFVALPAAAATSLPQFLLPPSLSRLAIATVVGVATTAVFGWFIAMTDIERKYIARSMQTAVAKLRPCST